MIKKLIAIICLYFSINLATAVNIADLYQTNIQVNSQSNEARNAALRSGMIEVITKLTGDSKIIHIAAIQNGLNKAESYVEEYSYLSQVNHSIPTISIRYNKNDINQLLKKAGIVYWGENRPLILIWLAISEPERETLIVGNESPHTMLNAIKQSSNQYGLPMIFPMMDMTDVEKVNPQIIDEMKIETLQEAGKRYSPEVLLIGKVNKTNQIKSDWQLIAGNEHWDWHFNDATVENMLTTLMKEINQVLAKHYAVKISTVSETILSLQVSHVNGGEDLQALMQYLQQLSIVKRVELLKITDDKVELSILIRGSSKAFEDNATIGQHMILKEADTEKQIWVYEWVS